MTPAFMSFGFAEMLLVGVVALIVFGGNLPDVMRSLGRSYAKLRQSLHEFSRPVREEMREFTRLPPPSRPPLPHAPDADEDVPPYPDDEAEPEAIEQAEAPPSAMREKPVPQEPSGPEIEEPPPV